ncbi:acetate/propionate family kinase [Methylobacterium sp. BTF04]|nr:acetate/propionate family kinase [Methylobacterium sp. BTF04]
MLTLNAGSSSLKFALFNAGTDSPATARGEIADLYAAPRLLARDAKGAVLADRSWPAGKPDAFATALDALLAFADSHLDQAGLVAVGHRIVHGGQHHVEPALVTSDILRSLETLIPLDPLHMPRCMAPIHAVAASRPTLPQIACFDTGFHATMPSEAWRFGLPRALEEAGVRRYGFHGLSYESIAARLARDVPVLAQGRVVVAHLGSGASLCAQKCGRSIATTMGFSTLDGLPMATRCGSLDPGVILYLGRQGRSFAEIEETLYRHSGLLGVSCISGDIRALLASPDPRAAEAVDLFAYRIAVETGALVSALAGLDGLVFTAGIGEHAPAIRSAVCARLAWLGLRIDEGANAANAGRICASDSAVAVLVIPTDEEAVIARHTRTVLRGRAAPQAA